MAEDQDEIMILDHAPLPLPRQQLPAADRELGHGQVQALGPVASLDAPLASPNAASASQFERNPSVHGGLASSATPDPLPAKFDGRPSSSSSSSVLANAPWLDSPVLPSEAFDKRIYHIPDYAGTLPSFFLFFFSFSALKSIWICTSSCFVVSNQRKLKHCCCIFYATLRICEKRGDLYIECFMVNISKCHSFAASQKSEKIIHRDTYTLL